MLTDQQWSKAIAEIESLWFCLVNNIMPPKERNDLRVKLAGRLRDLAAELLP